MTYLINLAFSAVAFGTGAIWAACLIRRRHEQEWRMVDRMLERAIAPQYGRHTYEYFWDMENMTYE